MVLLPALTGIVIGASVHAVQLAPTGKSRVPTVVPLTATVIGRADVVPLAYRNTTPTLPAALADTVHCMVAPDALVVLQNPVPENPAWLLSMVPWQVPFSASYLVAAAVGVGTS